MFYTIKNKLIYLFVFALGIQLILVSCSTISRENIKYDYLNFVFQHNGDELNSFKNTFTKRFIKGKKVTVKCFVDTRHKKRLLKYLEKIDFFSIPKNLDIDNFNESKDNKLYIKHFGSEETLSWNFRNLKYSTFRDDILELQNILLLIQEDVLRYINIPAPIYIIDYHRNSN